MSERITDELMRDRGLFMEFVRYHHMNESEEEREESLETEIRCRKELEKELEACESYTAPMTYQIFSTAQTIIFGDLFGLYETKENLDSSLGMDSELFLQCERVRLLRMLLEKDQTEDQ
ncbi:MAG: hypothetical protein IJ252_15310 [Solobacterium sp.]|nr:hypothetical protein [Solobacterium sp.]